MFLATTALSEFWERDGPILFLGPWCLRCDRREEWAGLRYRVMPYPWEDRLRLYEAIEYVRACYERTLGRLTTYFNQVHGESRGVRYYRILLGPWLILYVHVLYDRYILLREALRHDGSLRTLTLAREDFRVPADVVDFVRSIETDRYNLQLFSQILHSLGHEFPARPHTTNSGLGSGHRTSAARKSSMRRVGRWLYRRTLEAAQARTEVGIVAGGFTLREMVDLACRTRLRVLPLHTPELPPYSVSPQHSERKGLSGIGADDEFENVLADSLPVNFPGRYLEGHRSARGTARDGLKHGIPAAIFSRTVAWTRDAARYMLAEAAEEGARVLAAQHGGGYGMDRYHLFEEHERSAADRYYVWGWADDSAPRLRNLPSHKVSRVAKKQRRTTGERVHDIVLIVAGQPRYHVGFWSGPVVSQWEQYRQWEASFASALGEVQRARLVIRPPPASRSYSEEVRRQIREWIHDVPFDEAPTLAASVARSNIAVVDYPSTTLLEVLVSGTPTLLFWDPTIWEMRPEAEPYLQALRDVGILWDSPEGAARKLELVQAEPETWWQQPEVRRAREAFTRRFALADPDWVPIWGRELLAAAGQAHERDSIGSD